MGVWRVGQFGTAMASAFAEIPSAAVVALDGVPASTIAAEACVEAKGHPAHKSRRVGRGASGRPSAYQARIAGSVRPSSAALPLATSTR